MKQFFITKFLGPETGNGGEIVPNRLTVKLKNESALKSNESLSLTDLSISSDESLTLERELSEEEYNYLNELAATAASEDAEYAAPDFSTTYFTMLEPSKDYGDIIKQLSENAEVEFAYEQEYPEKPVDASDDPVAIFQTYESAAPTGIAAFAAWDQSITGEGITVTDIEEEWDLNHEDFPSVNLVAGDNKINFANAVDHGTSVVGIICAVDNDKGIVGIAPGVTMQVASIRFGATFRVGKALAQAIKQSSAGDIILIEEQLQQGSIFLPVETFPDIFQLIELATKSGIIVVEPAGNGSNNLDNHKFFLNGKTIFNRNSPDFKDSGSIMVGAASSADPHTRMSFSNFGSRVDCFAYGENVSTTSKNNKYTRTFNGTSSASPIIAAAAALAQQHAAGNGAKLTPAQMRTLLSDPNNGTASASPGIDLIGVMPDMQKIIV